MQQRTSLAIHCGQLQKLGDELCVQIQNCIKKELLLRPGSMLGYVQKKSEMGGLYGRKDAPSTHNKGWYCTIETVKISYIRSKH